MGIFGLLIWLALIGVAAWALVSYVPMPQGMKSLIIIVAIVFGIVIALTAFGVLPMRDMAVPQVR
jgi:O-antigen ligase